MGEGRGGWGRCDCLPMIKYLANVSRHFLSRTCIRSMGTLEKLSGARTNMTAISISVYDIGPWHCRWVNVRRTVPLFYMGTVSGRPHLFSHIERVYHAASFRVFASGMGGWGGGCVRHLLLSPGISGLFGTNSIFA